MIEKTVLAIDPGTTKCGMALVRRKDTSELELLWRGIAPSEDLAAHIEEAHEVAPFSLIIVGSGMSGYFAAL